MSLLAATSCAAVSFPAQAQTEWQGTVSSDWFDAGNWNNGTPHESLSAIVITAEADNSPVVQGGNAETFGLFVGQNAAGSLLIQDGGTLHASEFVSITAGDEHSTTVIVSGPGSTLSTDFFLRVGNTAGTSILTIEDGATVSNDLGNIAQAAGSLGIVTVTGAGSSWTNGEFIVGRGGHGVLTIADGATVSNTGYAAIGQEAGATGEVFVNGTDSTWTYADVLIVGESGRGHLDVSDGGAVTGTEAVLGLWAGSEGTAMVAGAGSSFTQDTGLYVGYSGVGELIVEDGGAVSNVQGYIGDQTDSEGTVRISGAGSTWTNSEELRVGAFGAGELTVENGGRVSSRTGIVGEVGSGTVQITGAGSSWINSESLFVGFSGIGELNIEDGGSVSYGGGGSIGGFGSSEGTVRVTGANSSLTASATSLLHVGYEGIGTLIVDDGALVRVPTIHVGYGSSGNGSLILSGTEGARATLQTGQVARGAGAGSVVFDGGILRMQQHQFDLFAGFAPGDILLIGEGAFIETVLTQVATGAALQGDGGLTKLGQGILTLSGVNTYTGGTTVRGGTLAVDGGSITHVGADVVVGQESGDEAMFSIAGGGTVSNRLSVIGANAGSLGEASVSGEGSTWTHAGDLIVGDAGMGLVTIDNGGTVSNVNGILGSQADGIGGVMVAGAGSTWTVGDGYNSGHYLAVGDAGVGQLLIYDGAWVRDVEALVGNQAGSEGEVIVSGPGATWEHLRTSSIGVEGFGSLTIRDGGTVIAGALSSIVGNQAGSEGIVLVTGPGSTWDHDSNSTSLVVGLGGTGTLVIENEGAVFNTVGLVGYEEGASGSVTVRGAGSTWANSGELHVGRAGTGLLTIQNGGAVTVGEEIFVGFGTTGNGSIVVTGQNSSLTGESFPIGFDGQGSLLIANGGSVNSGSGTIGSGPDSTGSATVVGTGSTWTASSLIVGWQGTGSLTVGDGGTVFVDAELEVNNRIMVANTATSAGALNIGAAVGDTPIAPGTLNNRVQFGQGEGSLNFNHTATDYVFEPGISGEGAVNVFAGTTIFNDSKQYTGPTTIYDGGTLIVNGSIASSSELTVQEGGQIGGTGTLPSIVFDGGVASPGNSIGTMNIGGDVTFNAGSVYEVEVDPESSDSDLIHATGQAILNGGSAVHIGLDGNYRPSSSYTILIAEGGITGEFDDVVSDFAFLDASLAYDANSITLSLVRNDIDFAEVAESANQAAIATVLDELDPGDDLVGAIFALGEDDARSAFDALSGEVHASVQSLLVDGSRLLGSTALARAGLAPSLADDRFTHWIQVFVGTGSADGSDGAAGTEHSRFGLLGGLDTVLGQTWRLGLLAGYTRTGFSVDDRQSSGSVRSLHLGAYGGGRLGAFDLRAGAAYGRHGIDTQRNVVFPGFAEDASASYDADTLQAFAELGYRFVLTADRSITPFAGLEYVVVTSDGFAEDGGIAALEGTASTFDALIASLGVRGTAAFSLGGFAASAHASISWRHVVGDAAPAATLSIAGSDSFTVHGRPLATDTANFSLGLDVEVGTGTDVGITYEGEFGDGFTDHTVRGTLSLRF